MIYMDWGAIGAIAELTAALGVIASLIYVATQVRFSNRASVVQAKLETTRFMTDYGDMILAHPNLFEVLGKGQADYLSLNGIEKSQFNFLALKAFWFFSAGFFQFRQKNLPETEWFELRAIVHFWLGTQGCKDWWADSGHTMFDAGFIAFIEDEMAKVVEN